MFLTCDSYPRFVGNNFGELLSESVPVADAESGRAVLRTQWPINALITQVASEHMNVGELLFRPNSREPANRTIAIIGAGFSGTLTAVNLLQLRHARPLRILLIDQNAFGRGVAYASRPYPYLLNVQARRMSANSADPLEFLTFLQRDLPLATARAFVPREIYGEYLRWKLARAEAGSPSKVQLSRIPGSASAIERTRFAFRIRLAEGRTLLASTIVLALGNPPPARLPAAESVRGSTRYIEDPWAEPPAFGPGETVLIAGTGLTMADIALAGNESSGGRAIIYAVSSHGLMSASETNFREFGDPDSAASLLTQDHPLSVRLLFKLTRALCDGAVCAGGDWRAAIAEVSAVASTLWHALSESERQRFLRHVRAYWDVHRHRLPPRSWRAIDELRRNGTLHVRAGRVIAMQISGKKIRVRWRPRGKNREQILSVDRVINCTGPEYDLRNTRNRLWHSLFTRGIAVPDPHGLGLLTGEFGALRDASGHPVRDLYYVGPMLRADHWETIAVQDLRAHAERLACHLTASNAEQDTQRGSMQRA